MLKRYFCRFRDSNCQKWRYGTTSALPSSSYFQVKYLFLRNSNHGVTLRYSLFVYSLLLDDTNITNITIWHTKNTTVHKFSFVALDLNHMILTPFLNSQVRYNAIGEPRNSFTAIQDKSPRYERIGLITTPHWLPPLTFSELPSHGSPLSRAFLFSPLTRHVSYARISSIILLAFIVNCIF